MLNFQDLFDNIFLKSVKAVIVIDDKNLKYAKHHYSNFIKDFYLIYPALNFTERTTNHDNVSKKIKNIFKNPSKFLTIVGTLDIKKNTIEAIKLLKFLNEKKQKYELVIVGAGELESELKKSVEELLLSNKVYFTGKVNFDELSYIYQNTYCNLFFAKNQTWGLTPFEALMYNKPSIVSNESGCSEFLERHKINYIYKLNDSYEGCLKFLEENCQNFTYDKSKLVELLPKNYIKKLLSIIF